MLSRMRALAGILLVLAVAAALWLALRERAAAATRLAPPGSPGIGAAERPPEPRTSSPPLAPPGNLATAAGPDAAGAPLAGVEGAVERAPAGLPAAEDLVVRVVDRAGAPVAGLPLRLAAPDDEEQRLSEDALQRTSDARGEARFPRARPVLEAAARPWRLVHEVAFEERPERVLDPAALREPVCVSVQPPWCSVEVQVSDLDGQPAPEGTDVRLELVLDGEESDPELAHDRPSFDGTARGGRALFPFAEPARAFEARAQRPGSGVASHSRERASAPAGGLARLAVVLGADHPEVVFRVLDASGTPLALAELELRPPFAIFGDRRATSDREGRVVVESEASGFLHAGTWVFTHETAEGVLLLGRAQFPGDVGPGRHEGGDVVLAPAPLLVAGRVVDDAGRPLAGARVLAGDQGDGWGGGSRRVEGESDEDGRFELHGLLHGVQFPLSAQASGGRSESVEVREGERSALLVVAARWSVSARILADPWLDPGRFQLELVDAAGNRRGPSRSGGLLLVLRSLGSDQDPSDEEEDRVVFESVAPGTYALVASLDEQPLRRIEGIVVDADVDVEVVDLRGAVTLCEIVLLGASDPQELSGEVAWRPSGSEDDWRSADFSGDVVEVLAARVPIDVCVWAEGHREGRVDEVSGSASLVLEPALRVRLELVTDGPLPAYPYLFAPRLTQDGEGVGSPQGYFTDTCRSLVVLVPSPGPTRVGWGLERRGESFAIGGGVLTDQEREIEILDVPGEQVFRIELDATALARLVAKPPW